MIKDAYIPGAVFSPRDRVRAANSTKNRKITLFRKSEANLLVLL